MKPIHSVAWVDHRLVAVIQVAWAAWGQLAVALHHPWVVVEAPRRLLVPLHLAVPLVVVDKVLRPHHLP